MAPGFGDAVDVVDGGICLIRRDWTGAALAFGAALPIIGSVLGPLRKARKAKPVTRAPSAAGGLATSVSKARETKRDVNAVSGAKRATDAAPTPRPKALKKVEPKSPRITGDALAKLRTEFNALKPQAWMDEAAIDA